MQQLKDHQKYINIILGILVFVFFLFTVGILLHFDFLYPGDQGIQTKLPNVYEGNIITADGVLLSTNNYGTADAQAQTGGPQRDSFFINIHKGTLTHPHLYSALLGYNSSFYGRSGLRKLYQAYLYDGKREKPGKTLELTINHRLQKLGYEILKQHDADGSAVVMNNHTGAIEALVSYKQAASYNANKIDKAYDTWNQISDFWYPEWRLPVCPGSTFKIVSGLGIIESGNSGFVYKDTSGAIKVNGEEIQNAGHKARGTLTLKEALRWSANVYFIKLYRDVVDPKYLSQQAEKFLLGSAIPTDFATLKSTWEVDANDAFNVAQTSFGQGNTQLTPVHSAMILASVVNGGDLLKPYVVASKTEKSNFFRTFLQKLFHRQDSKRTVLEHIGPDAAVAEMKEDLAFTASKYGFKQGHYAKTGTAQLPNKDIQIWMVAATDNYTAVLSLNKKGSGEQLWPDANSLLDLAEKLSKNRSANT